MSTCFFLMLSICTINFSMLILDCLTTPDKLLSRVLHFARCFFDKPVSHTVISTLICSSSSVRSTSNCLISDGEKIRLSLKTVVCKLLTLSCMNFINSSGLLCCSGTRTFRLTEGASGVLGCCAEWLLILYQESLLQELVSFLAVFPMRLLFH